MAEPQSPYVALIKPRIVSMQLITVAMGFFLARIETPVSWWLFPILLVGTFLTAGGAAALNHFLERNIDKLMKRTQDRPLPSGKISPTVAAIIGFALLFSGLGILWIWTNSWVVFLSFLTAFLYVLVYTPLKQISWINTFVGAIPGAIPPLAGWVAVAGHLDPVAWQLFWILYFWQMPHFFAIAWALKDDYERAGFKMLSVEDPSGDRTLFQMMAHSVILLMVSMVPVFTGKLGLIYAVLAGILGVWMVSVSLRFRTSRTRETALSIMKTSIIYLPLLLVAILLDVVFYPMISVLISVI